MVRHLKIISLLGLALAISAQRIPFQKGFPPGSSLTGNALANSMLAYYNMNEGALNNALDSSGGGRNLTRVGSIASGVGKVNTARSASNGAYFTYADNDTFEARDRAFSFALWFKFDGSIDDGETGVILAKAEDATSGKQSYVLSFQKIGADTFFNFAVSEDGINYALNYLQLEIELVAGNWYCIICRVDPSSGEYKMDIREPAGSWIPDFDTYGGTVDDNTSSFTVGGILDSSSTLQYPLPAGCLVDELVFWHVALTDCQMDAYFNSGMGLAQTYFNTYPCL